MTSRLNPYLTFAGNANDAMEFYESVFGGILALDTFGDYGQGDPEIAGKVMHARLDTERGFTLMASDAQPGMELQAGNTVAVSLSGDDAEVLRSYWDRLSVGSDIEMPLEKQVWGDTFGMCTDKFGLRWMVNITESSR
jgi:PhnB protein